MRVETILETVRQAGGAVWIEGEKLRYRLPIEEVALLEALRLAKPEVLDLLSSRPAMPPGVKLVRWKPLPSPVRINRYTTVADVDLFIRSTLRQMEAALEDRSWQAGNWGLYGLLERLAAVGCVVALDNPRRMLQ